MKKRAKILLILSIVALLLSTSLSLSFSQSKKSADKQPASQAEQVVPSDVQTREDFLPEEPSSKLGFGYYFNLIVSLLIIAGLIIGVSYLFKYLFARMPSFGGREDFKVISSLRMSPQTMLYVVRFADEIYLLAATPQNVCVVSRVDDPDRVKDIIESMSETAGAVNPHAFSTLLGKRIEKAVENESSLEKERLKKDQNTFEETSRRLEGYEKPTGKEGK